MGVVVMSSGLGGCLFLGFLGLCLKHFMTVMTLLMAHLGQYQLGKKAAMDVRERANRRTGLNI